VDSKINFTELSEMYRGDSNPESTVTALSTIVTALPVMEI
jgi:hypothetical protein